MTSDQTGVIERRGILLKRLGYFAVMGVLRHSAVFHVYKISDVVTHALWLEGRAGPTRRLKDADMVATGYVKYDGRSNWKINGYAHFGGRGHLPQFGEMMARLWDEARSAIPMWSE